jgi:hypothetical protein
VIETPGQRRVLLPDDEPTPDQASADKSPPTDEEVLAGQDAATPESAEYLSLALFLRRTRALLPDGLDLRAAEKRLSRLSRKSGRPVKRAPDGNGGLVACFALEVLVSFCPAHEKSREITS